MVEILVAGVAVVDFVFNVDEMPKHPEKYRSNNAIVVGGGCAANAAVAISRMGGHAHLAARLGDDAIGDMILADLQLEDINTDLVNRANGGRSSFSSVYVDKSGERQIMNFRGSGLVENTSWLNEIPQVGAVLADNRWPPITKELIATAAKRDIPAIIDGEDPVDLTSLKNASHIAFSKQGLVALTGEGNLGAALKAASAKLSSWLCVTDGQNGVYFLHNGRVEHIPGFHVEVKDTLGAGDVWHGAFALSLAEGENVENAIQFANAAASLKCTQPGGRAGCPNRTAVKKFLKERT